MDTQLGILPLLELHELQQGKKEWKAFLPTVVDDRSTLEARIKLLNAFFQKYLPPKFGDDEIQKLCPAEMKEHERLLSSIFNMMEEADHVADSIREKVRLHLESKTQLREASLAS